MKIIAIIVPVYNEAGNLELLYSKLDEVFSTLSGYEWRLIFVNDGSVDNSWEVINRLSGNDSRISGICLSRNFGKEIALTAGVESIEQDIDAVICIDADLQHPPEMIPEFIKQWEKGADIVVGIRKKVSGYSFVKKTGSKLFYAIMTRFSDVNIPPNSTDFRLLDKKVVQTLCRFSERTRMFRGLIDWLGFQKTHLEFSAPDRQNGNPTYSYKKLFDLAINSITSFSLLPLRLTGYLGILVCALSGLLLIYMVITDFLFFQIYTPQAYFAVFNTLLVGVVLSGLGMLALYIGHIHTEVVGRPLYIIQKRVGNNHSPRKNKPSFPDAD